MDAEQPREVGWGRRSRAGRAVVVVLALAAVVLGAWLANTNVEPLFGCDFATSRAPLPGPRGDQTGVARCAPPKDNGWLLTLGVLLLLAGLVTVANALSRRSRVPTP